MKKQTPIEAVIMTVISALIVLAVYGGIRFVKTNLLSKMQGAVKEFGIPVVVAVLGIVATKHFQFAPSITVAAVISLVSAVLDQFQMYNIKDFVGLAGEGVTLQFKTPEEAAEYLKAQTVQGEVGGELIPLLEQTEMHGEISGQMNPPIDYTIANYDLAGDAIAEPR